MSNPLSQAEMPKVTIAIPTLNRAGYLRLALESALAQTYSNIEVVVSNNASTDETASYLASLVDPRLRVLHQTQLLPMVENWNACFSASSGEYFLLLSDDDLLERDAIHELVGGYLQCDENQPAPGIVYCGGRIIDSAGNVTRTFNHSPLRETASELIPAFFEGNRDLWFCAILFRTADILPCFPVTFQLAADSATWIKATVRHRDAVFIPKELARYRVHNSITFSTSIDQWQREISLLSEFAIKTMAEKSGPDPVFSHHLRRIVRRHNILIIPPRINQPLHEQKLKALIEYARRLHWFLSPFGLNILIRGLASLLLPEEVKINLRKLRRRPTHFA